MTKWFDLAPVDEAFFENAEHRFVYPMRLRAAPDEVWAGLTMPRPLRHETSNGSLSPWNAPRHGCPRPRALYSSHVKAGHTDRAMIPRSRSTSVVTGRSGSSARCTPSPMPSASS